MRVVISRGQKADGIIAALVADSQVPATEVINTSAVMVVDLMGRSFRVERLGETSEVRAIAKSGHHSAMPRVLRSPEWDATRRLAAALESAREDPPYRAALPHVLWMIERS